ncbi:MAG TPA: NAD(P)-binding domain-containing protein [Burkholderiaceae bacterium]|nr:NAD(P)-binding domain-containing protein [Burkholderiaceae bacterium]
MKRTIGFIGLGTMGGPMAAHLAKAGHRVQGVDLDPAKVAALEAAGGTASANIAAACANADTIITILPRDQHVRDALLGENGVIRHAAPGTLVLEMSTILPRTSLDIAQQLQAADLRMMDAPVGRTPADARAGRLLVMAGGSKEDFADAQPLFACFADKVLHMGALGTGIQMKVINNYMSMVSMVLTSETLTMAKKAGIATPAAVEVLQNTVAGRGQINTNFPKKVLAGDITPDFPLSLGYKDLSLGLALGHELGTPLFLGASALELFGMAPAMGRADQDCTAMLLILEQLAGIKKD